MKYLRSGFWVLVGLSLVIVGMANTQPIQLRALPGWLAEFVGVSPDITMPLYLAIFAGVGFGLLVGFFWEWLREHKHRRAMRQNARNAVKLEREVNRLRTGDERTDDEVLALLDKS